VITGIWLALMLFIVVDEVNSEGRNQFQLCMGTNTFAQYDEGLKKRCSYSAEYANVISVAKFIFARNEKSDTMRLFIWIPVGLWWGFFWVIGWVAEGAKGKGTREPGQ